MPVFESNGNGIIIPKWLLPILLSLLIASAAWASGVSFRAQSALPRIEAAQTYMTKTEGRESEGRIDRRLDQLTREVQYTNKLLDQLLAR